MTPLNTKPRVQIDRWFDADPTDVFDAWIDPKVRMQWWSAGPGRVCDLCEIDARVGGRYRINMKDPDGSKEYIVGGEFLEIDRPRRLRFSWTWETTMHDQGASKDTIVAIDLTPVDGGTRLVLTHEGFGNET